jgi:multicomponent Na+:H+ antiporter subunit D
MIPDVFQEHLPVLQVVVPLLAAPLCVLVRGSRASWSLAMLISWLVLAMAACQLWQVHSVGPVVYQLGGWAEPWGIEYRLDRLGALVLLVIGGVAAVVLMAANRLLEDVVPESRRYLFFATFLLCLTGLLGIVSTGDLFNVFVFLEIASLSSYVLISMGRSRRALAAAFSYLVMGTIGSTFILIGIGLSYMMTGTLNIADLADRLRAVDDPVNQTRTIQVAFAFLTVGLSLKLAVFPLHAWLPNAYSFAPSLVSAFLAATSTKVAYYLLLRTLFTIFGVVFVFDEMNLSHILMPLALMAIFVGSAVAIYQTDLSRLLAYSSVAQIGYLVLAVSFATVTGLTAGIIHLFNHAMMKGGLFLVTGCLVCRLNSTALSDLRGFGRRMPWTMAAFVVGGLNLIGVPLTSGFISKWYLVLAALEQDLWGVAVLVLAGSLLSVVYVWRVIEVAWFADPDRPLSEEVREAPAIVLVPAWILLGATLVFGVYTDLPVDVAQVAAQMLMEGGL